VTFEDVERAAQVDKKFADLGIVDASIVALAERLDSGFYAAFDPRD
jgi:predicted nucleic acid-binding protein